MADIASAAGSLFEYFSPTKSPYYTIGIAASFALAYVSDVEGMGFWLTLAIPAYLVAALTFILSLKSINTLTPEEHAGQLRFARSTCISTAVLSLAYFGEKIAHPINRSVFIVNAVFCCAQIALFLTYNWAYNKQRLAEADRNYVQITLLTSAFLVDTSYNLSEYTKPHDPESFHHACAAAAMGLLWLCAAVFWVRKFVRLIHLEIRLPAAGPPDPLRGPDSNPIS